LQLKNTDAPPMRHRLLRRLIPGVLQPTLRAWRRRFIRPHDLKEPYKSVYPYTIVMPERQENLLRLATDIDSNSVPGCIVECGVLDGGTAALMARATADAKRPVHLFDSWAGLPQATDEDGDSGGWSGNAVGSPRRVLNIMRKLGVARERVHLHQGWFSDTFSTADIDQIALLHVDADFYESVRLCLDHWYPRLSPGGYIQFDDYDDFVGCRRAVDAFLAQTPGLRLRSDGPDGSPIKARFLQKPITPST
jgi:O-methyltransferase